MESETPQNTGSAVPLTEQRKYPRYAVDFPARLYYEDGTIRYGTVLDISREGCRIRCTDALPDAKYIRMELRFTGPGGLLTVDLAVVRWFKPPHLGLEVIRLSQPDQERLHAVIHSCEAATTPPGPGMTSQPSVVAEEPRGA